MLGIRETPNGEEEQGLSPDTVPYCEAFPYGIPDAISRGRDHSKPYPHDHGIRFEPVPAEP